jgi:hypothetical protein
VLEAAVLRNMEIGAATKEDAIRWVIASLGLEEIDLMYGAERVCYELNLPYDMSLL